MSFENLKPFDQEYRRTNTIRDNVIPILTENELKNKNFSYLYYKYKTVDEFARTTYEVALMYELIGYTDKNRNVVYLV